MLHDIGNFWLDSLAVVRCVKLVLSNHGTASRHETDEIGNIKLDMSYPPALLYQWSIKIVLN